ncbi:MAG: hypothetical protein U0893_26250 [Chloroflexota bacterium]
MKLHGLLEGCSSSQLARLAAAWQLPVEAGTLRRELVELLVAQIGAGLTDQQTWAALEGRRRDAARVLARAGGRHEADLLAQRLLGVSPRAADLDDEARAVVHELDTATASLLDRGLLFRVFDGDEGRQGVYLVMAEEGLEAARAALGDDRAGGGLNPFDSTPEHVTAIDLHADLFVLASALRREAWSAASRKLAGRPARSVGQLLSLLQRQAADGPGVPGQRWRFLLWIAQRAGWLRRDGWPLPDDERLERLLRQPDTIVQEALAVSPVAGTEVRGRNDRPRAGRRQADALQLLSELDVDRWWPADRVASWLAETLTSERADDSRGGNLAHRRRAQLYQRWLAGRWFWLGLVRWGGDDADWTHVAPTPSLLSLMRGTSSPGHAAAVPCLLESQLHLLAPPGADLPTLSRAERYLAFGGSGDEGRHYTVTPASFERGVRLGGDADELASLLARLAQQPLPVSWQQAIHAWTDERRRLQLGARLLLWSEEPGVLAESLRSVGAGDDGLEQISERHALVRGDRVAQLLTALAQAGLPVDVEPGVRAEPTRPGQAASLADGVAETAWVALEVLRRLAPDVVADRRDLRAASGRIESVLSPRQLEALERRATTIAAAIADRRRPRKRATRVVP